MTDENDQNIVVMDGPGPFFFGRLEGPLELVEPSRVGAVAIRGTMEVDESGRRVTVMIPVGDDDAMRLLRLLQRHRDRRGLNVPD